MNNAIETIYQDLCETASTTVKNKLYILKQACESQLRGKSTDFSVATISRISEDMGGVKEQTLRNKTKNSKLYRHLIQTYAAYYSKPVIKQVKVNDNYQLANCIEDTASRIMVFELIAINKKLQNELNLLKNVQVIELDHRKKENRDDVSALDDKLTSQERKALTGFTSDNHLKDIGWTIGKHGRLVDVNGRPVTKPFFVDAINKLSVILEI